MRTSPLAFVALPVLVGGIVITTAVVFVGTAEAPTPTLGKSIGVGANGADTAGPVPEPGDGTRPGTSAESGNKTEINGSRPHLTVIDGRAAVAPLGAIPAALSLLPPPSIGLPPLPDLGGDLVWPADGGSPRGQTAPGADELDESGAQDVRWTGPTSPAEPDSLPPRTPGSASPLTVVPERPSQADGGGGAEPGSGSRPPPTAGRPGRPPSDLVNLPAPSDTVGHPGQDTGRPPPMMDPERLPPGADLLTPDKVVPDAVTPEENPVRDLSLLVREIAVQDREFVDVNGGRLDDVPHLTARDDLDESPPSLR